MKHGRLPPPRHSHPAAHAPVALAANGTRLEANQGALRSFFHDGCGSELCGPVQPSSCSQAASGWARGPPPDPAQSPPGPNPRRRLAAAAANRAAAASPFTQPRPTSKAGSLAASFSEKMRVTSAKVTGGDFKVRGREAAQRFWPPPPPLVGRASTLTLCCSPHPPSIPPSIRSSTWRSSRPPPTSSMWCPRRSTCAVSGHITSQHWISFAFVPASSPHHVLC